MRCADDRTLVLAPTDLAAFLACRHRTGLDLAVARGTLTASTPTNAYAAMLRDLGERHEAGYVSTLRAQGRRVVTIDPARTGTDAERLTATLDAMQGGADVIVQARLADDDLAGYADILIRVDTPSELGPWSYEVQDTKLAHETKAGTILQLAAYSDLVARIQRRAPDSFHVVTPAGTHTYRLADYAAYYRMVLDALRRAVTLGHDALLAQHYPEPVEHCTVCRWAMHCESRRRRDNHPSYIAGAGRHQRIELAAHGCTTLAAVATLAVPVTFTPARGARQTYGRLVHQARVQHQQRTERRPVVEPLPTVPGEGVYRLPAPSPGDIFLDLEGARFAREGGREYLFGVWTAGTYRAWWATTDAEERHAFEAVMDLVAAAWTAHPDLHVYHFNHYEPTAFRRLVGRYVTRGDVMDQLLRAERFVDLYPIVRQTVRAGVESYSIKQLEQYYGYTRRVSLKSASQPLLAVEMSLESGVIDDEIRAIVQGYNEDDCRSTEALRDWLERLRDERIAAGASIPRPELKAGDPSPRVSEQQQRAADLRARLLDGLPADAADPTHPDHPRWLLAYLVDFHKREENAAWWDFFRLIEAPAENLVDEGAAITGLTFVERLGPEIGRHGKPSKRIVDRYTYPPQDVEIGLGAELHARDGNGFGTVAAHDRLARRLDVRKQVKRTDEHPSELFAVDVVSTAQLQESVMRLAERVLAGARDECAVQLLYRERPRLDAMAFAAQDGETPETWALRAVSALDRTVLAIQGPPGAGKTFVGAQMIRTLVRAGRRVGITATSHKVIRNLLDEVARQAAADGETVRVAAKANESDETDTGIRVFTDNAAALEALAAREVDVLGGTAWLWARPESADSVDVLFVDEAGQMALASVLAVAHAAGSLVLLGDPQQLGQPLKATHPDGVGLSALDHVLAGQVTMPADRGIFLPTTWRMSPTLTAFTSELFYDARLSSHPHLAGQALGATGTFDGSRLWLVPVAHDGNTSVSTEEVEAVDGLVATLLSGTWTDAHGRTHGLTGSDLRVVAPFNAHVNRLTERLAPRGVPVGTVDKFQGQTAAIVIYALATSRADDAPRGIEFLYSLNRLNVATSRARCAVFVVCSPRLLEPECRTPRQMALANALCRYREMATVVTWPPAHAQRDTNG